MTKEELINKVDFILDEEGLKELLLFCFVAGDDNAYKINISGELETELIKVVEYGIQSMIVDKEYEIVDFSTADERRNKYYLYDLDDVPERMRQMSYVIGNHYVPVFDLQHKSIEEINTLIILLSDRNGSTFTLYKSLSPVEKVVKSTKSILAKIGVGEDSLIEESKPILRIGPHFQLIYLSDAEYENGGKYVFLDSSSMEGQFKLNQVLNNEATTNMIVLENTHIVKDTIKIKQYIEKPAFCRKLVKVLRNSKVIKEGIPKETIFQFINNDDELREVLTVSEFEGEQYIDINSQKSAQRLLDLLNDEFVYSSLTNQKYQAVDKDER